MNHQKRMNKQVRSERKPDKHPAQPDGMSGPSGTSTAGSQDAYQRVLRYAGSGNYQKALDVLRSAGRQPQMRNALGVCLLRLGRAEDAMRIFRELVLSAGCTWMRPDAPMVHKINFATALLLGGHPAGCMEILSELKAENLPAVQKLRQAIRSWQTSLPFWKRLNWRLGSIEPKGYPVTLDFPPGEFELESTLAEGPPSGSTDPSLRTAV